MEVEIYHKGKQYIAKTLEELSQKLSEFLNPKTQEIDLTAIRFEIIIKMLEIDPKLRKLVKGLALTYL
jgi:hypothetical protein